MKKIIKNVLLLNLLALPCLLTFNDVNPETGEWNYTINIVGIMYSIWYYRGVLKNIIKI